VTFIFRKAIVNLPIYHAHAIRSEVKLGYASWTRGRSVVRDIRHHPNLPEH
jgi:hypothetical protein